MISRLQRLNRQSDCPSLFSHHTTWCLLFSEPDNGLVSVMWFVRTYFALSKEHVDKQYDPALPVR